MSFRLRLIALLLGLFAVVGANSYLNYRLASVADTRLEWVNHTHEVLLTTEQFLSALKDAETGQRGFLLTLDPSYLEPHHAGVEEVAERLEELRLLTSDNRAQQDRLVELGNVIAQKLAELDRTIDLAENGDLDGALELVRLDEGHEFMNRAREILKEFIDEENRLLEKRQSDFNETSTLMSQLVVVEFVVLALGALAAIVFVYRHSGPSAPKGTPTAIEPRDSEGSPE